MRFVSWPVHGNLHEITQWQNCNKGSRLSRKMISTYPRRFGWQFINTKYAMSGSAKYDKIMPYSFASPDINTRFARISMYYQNNPLPLNIKGWLSGHLLCTMKQTYMYILYIKKKPLYFFLICNDRIYRIAWILT